MTHAKTHRVASENELLEGKTLCLNIDGKAILLCHSKEGFYAVDNLCTHAAEPLSGGKLKGSKIFCPLHGAAFDIKTGAALSRPASVALQTYPVTVEAGEVFIELD